MLCTSAVGTTHVYLVNFESVPILSHYVERVECGCTMKLWKCPEDTFYGVDCTLARLTHLPNIFLVR